MYILYYVYIILCIILFSIYYIIYIILYILDNIYICYNINYVRMYMKALKLCYVIHWLYHYTCNTQKNTDSTYPLLVDHYYNFYLALLIDTHLLYVCPVD